MLFTEDPYQPEFYYPIILCLLIFLALIQILVFYFKESLTIDELDDVTNYKSKEFNLELSKKKDSLWFRYLMGFIGARASIWAKSPYMYLLFSQYQKFDIREIGVLYSIDAGTALIIGPIFGSLADKYGRKKFSMLYSILGIVNLTMRLSSYKSLTYLAQVLTGMGSGIVSTIFEAWVIYEANKEFGTHNYSEKDKFIKKLFKTQNIIDACTSIIVSAICAMAYYVFGILGPIFISIIFSFLSMIIIGLSWDENKPGDDKKHNTLYLYKAAFKELKKREIITVGIMESLWSAVLHIFIFAWTPILQSSTDYSFNPGMIFFCFVLLIICGTKLYEVFIIHLKTNPYISLFACLLIEIMSFFIIYMVENFTVRFLMCTVINGICGFYQPVNSIIKAKILKENVRALLMNMFRVPLNIYVVSILVLLKQLETGIVS